MHKYAATTENPPQAGVIMPSKRILETPTPLRPGDPNSKEIMINRLKVTARYIYPQAKRARQIKKRGGIIKLSYTLTNTG